MHFSLPQQRTAFLAQACLGSAHSSAAQNDSHNRPAQLVATLDSKGIQRLIVERDGAQAQLVNPLLLGFNRAAQRCTVRQHSARASREELSWRYSLRLVQYQNEFLLVGIQNDSPDAAKLLIGRGETVSAQIQSAIPHRCPIRLEPGWHWVRQTYNDQETPHLYLVQRESLSALTTSYGPGQPPMTMEKARESQPASAPQAA